MGVHPRPQLTRTIQVPFPPESPASGLGETAYHPIVWYRRTFRVADEGAGRRLLLYCGAVDYRAHVWVNGQLVATHEGGQTPFSADITTALRPGEEQVVVIRAEDAPLDLAQPRGKQDWQEEPHAIWYRRTTGIWQPVWLEPVGPLRITQIRWTPDVERGSLNLFVRLRRDDDTALLRMRVQLSMHGETIADDSYKKCGQMWTCPISCFKLPLFTKQPTRGQVTLRATSHMAQENSLRRAWEWLKKKGNTWKMCLSSSQNRYGSDLLIPFLVSCALLSDLFLCHVA